MNKRDRTSALTLAVLLSIALFTGCGLLGQDSGQAKQGEQEAKIPKQLEEMEASIEKVFQALGGPARKSKDEDGQQQSGQGKEDKQQEGKGKEKNQKEEPVKEQGKGKEQEKDKQEGQGKEEGQDKKDEQDQGQAEDPWQQVSKEITGLHYQWNEYLPEAAKKGVKQEIIDNFSKSLNDLTRISAEKDKIKTMLAASSLYANMPEIYALYKPNTTSELKMITRYARDTVLSAVTGDWEKASSDLEHLQSSWGYLKNTLDQEMHEESTKLALSIAELAKVVNLQDPKLVDLKGRIVLSNLVVLEKSIEENSKKKDQPGNNK